MWITSTTIPENLDMALTVQQITDAAAERDAILAEGVETGGHLLPPYDDTTAAAAAFAPGVVFKRGWVLESSARRIADFMNNHASKQIIAVVEQQQDI